MTYEIKFVGNEYTNSSSRNGNVPCLIVDHISDGSWSSLLSWFTSPNNKTSSAHFGVSKKGEIVQFVPMERMAWANGINAEDIAKSKTPIVKDHPNKNPNLYSVSIEHEGTDGDLTEEQYQATLWLHRYIRDYVKEKWGYEISLTPYDVIGHFQVSPGKPLCPGPKFPWDRLYADLQKSESGNMSKPKVVKERIYLENGILKRCDGDYSKTATDVRWIKFDKNKIKLKLVWKKGATVSQLVKEHGADYGFNFPFFWDGNPVADCKIGNQILNRGYDDPNGAKQTIWHGFAYKNGVPLIDYFDINDDYGPDGFVLKTTPLLLNGQGVECWDWYRIQEGTASDIGKSGNTYVSAQRTFIGIDANGDLILAVADGRTKYDKGLTLEEMAKFMKSKGALWALNGDGGSSSVIADKTGSLGQNQGASERAVNHAVLVYLVENNNNSEEPKPEEKDWKQLGLEWLQENLDVSTDWKKTDVIDIGTLGEILKRFNEKSKGE